MWRQMVKWREAESAAHLKSTPAVPLPRLSAGLAKLTILSRVSDRSVAEETKEPRELPREARPGMSPVGCTISTLIVSK